MAANKSNAAAVKKIRADIEAGRDEIRRIQSAALPTAEFEERLTAWINANARQFDAASFFAGLYLPNEGVDVYTTVRKHGIVSRADLGPFLAWSMGDQIKDSLIAELADRCDDSAPVSTARPAEIDRLELEIESLERREESLIREAESSGESIRRRADARPDFVLAADEYLS